MELLRVLRISYPPGGGESRLVLEMVHEQRTPDMDKENTHIRLAYHLTRGHLEGGSTDTEGELEQRRRAHKQNISRR